VGTESALTVPHRGAGANADRVEVAAGLADRVLHLGAGDALALADDRVRVVLVEHVGGARSEPLAGPAGHRGSEPELLHQLVHARGVLRPRQRRVGGVAGRVVAERVADVVR